MNDLLSRLIGDLNLSVVDTALLVLVFFLASQRYKQLNQASCEQAERVERLEKTFIKEGVELYRED